MKLECEKIKIELAVQKATRLTKKHLTLPVLSCVYLELLKDNVLIIKSTNLDLGLEIKIKVKTITPGIVVVPGSVLQNTLTNLKDENIIFETEENNLKIKSKKNSVVIKCMSADDFPSIPRLENIKSIKIGSNELISGLKSVWYSASVSSIKPELSSVYIYQNNDNLIFVSTDSFRLAEKKVHVKASIDFPQTLLPNKNVSELIKIFEDYKDDVELLFEKNQAAFITKDAYIVSRLVDGSFPDYKQIIPKEFKAEATVLKNDFVNALKASHIFSDSLNQVKLRVATEDKSLGVESRNNDVGEYKEAIKGTVSGENVELNFNNKYVGDCFQSIFSDGITLKFGGMGKPLVIQGASDGSFLYIVMPMNK